jgi:hypothetical protein
LADHPDAAGHFVHYRYLRGEEVYEVNEFPDRAIERCLPSLPTGSTRLFFSTDKGEPPHIHVAKSGGFAGHELNVIEKLVLEHGEILMRAWRDYFGA